MSRIEDRAEALLLQRLQDENELLREQLVQLRRALEPTYTLPPEWRLTPLQTRIVHLIDAKGLASTEALDTALNCNRDEATDPNLVRVHIHRIRARLRPFGFTIIARPWYGYSLCDKLKAALREQKNAMDMTVSASLTEIIAQALRDAENEAYERAAKEADYFAKYSLTAKNIAEAIRTELKHQSA